MKMLFLSFTGLLRLVAERRVSEADLNQGIFYFNCTRLNATDPRAEEVRWLERRHGTESARQAHDLIVASIEAAEESGRIRWRQIDERNSYEKLSELLVANGYAPLTDVPADLHYSRGNAEDVVKAAGLKLSVKY